MCFNTDIQARKIRKLIVSKEVCYSDWKGTKRYIFPILVRYQVLGGTFPILVRVLTILIVPLGTPYISATDISLMEYLYLFQPL